MVLCASTSSCAVHALVAQVQEKKADLDTVDLSGNTFSASAVEALFEALKNTSSVTV